MDQPAAFASSVLWELRFIHWLLITEIVVIGVLVVVLIAAFSGLGRQLEVVERYQAQKQFQERMEDLLTRGMATDALFAATEAIAGRPRDPYVYWYLGQANFQLKEYVKAKKAFSTVIEIAPNWAITVQPWLERVDEELRNLGPKVVK